MRGCAWKGMVGEWQGRGGEVEGKGWREGRVGGCGGGGGGVRRAGEAHSMVCVQRERLTRVQCSSASAPGSVPAVILSMPPCAEGVG